MPISTFLDGQNPGQLRGLQWLRLSDIGNFLTRTYVTDLGGGATQTWAVAGTVACSIESMAYRSGLVAARIDERSTHLVNVPAGTPVDNDDRFAISGKGTFEVTALHQQTAEWITEFEVVEVT
jgi:head-tail adaptor